MSGNAGSCQSTLLPWLARKLAELLHFKLLILFLVPPTWRRTRLVEFCDRRPEPKPKPYIETLFDTIGKGPMNMKAYKTKRSKVLKPMTKMLKIMMIVMMMMMMAMTITMLLLIMMLGLIMVVMMMMMTLTPQAEVFKPLNMN